MGSDAGSGEGGHAGTHDRAEGRAADLTALVWLARRISAKVAEEGVVAEAWPVFDWCLHRRRERQRAPQDARGDQPRASAWHNHLADDDTHKRGSSPVGLQRNGSFLNFTCP